MNRVQFAVALLLLMAVWQAPGQNAGAGPGIFDGHTDVGETPRAGKVDFDARRGEYRVTGGGANIWGDTDAFHFVWKRMSGDFTLASDASLTGAGIMAHRKAVLMVRQHLGPSAPHASIAVHGDGQTEEIRSSVNAPLRIRIERRGNSFTAYVGNPGEQLAASGPVSVALIDPVYVGLAVCSHDANVLETAVFSNVSLQAPAAQVRSHISILDITTGKTEVVYTAGRLFEAPNWSPDGTYLLVNSGGALWRLALDKQPAEPVRIALPQLSGCNNDHGISPDGRRYAISARGATGASVIYTASRDGTNVRQITAKAPSYFHGWSPDGKWLAYAAQRDGHFYLYRIPANGGEEERLTTNPAYDDGPDYSPDGKWIYFNSQRSGSWDIWRIPASGGGPDDSRAQQVTGDEYEDWFPHPSPDGKWMVFISFEKGTEGHPANRNVLLRMARLPGANPKATGVRVLTRLFGGQGTINVPSWSPDSKKFAFVSYEIQH
jgi:TolB protein